MQEEVMQLGGNIDLIGFNGIERLKLVVLKKMVGNYARKISEIDKFEKLSVKMDQKENDYEVNVNVASDKPKASEAIDKNLFVAVDNALKKIQI